MPAPRWLKLALLAYVVFWFGIVLPGHQRGRVTLPGARGYAAGAGCCDRHGGPAHRVPPSPCRPCAICFFAAHLTVPPAIDAVHAPLALLRVRALAVPTRPLARPVQLPFDGRAPPTTAGSIA